LENLVRRLRLALGWSQESLARRLGVTYSSARNYDRGIRPPPEVIERLRTIAAEAGLSDIAAELLSAERSGRRVFRPESAEFSEKSGKIQQEIQRVAKKGVDTQARPIENVQDAEDVDQRSRAHAMLDEIYRSQNPEVIAAVYRSLVIFSGYAQGRRPAEPGQARKRPHQ